MREDGTYVPFSADAWSYAGQMTLLGMGMVFSVLSILWVILLLFKLIFTAKPKTQKAPKTENKPQPVAVPEAVPAKEADDAELVAIITAAVAAYMADEGVEAPDGSFRVVSFKRVQSGRAWNSK